MDLSQLYLAYLCYLELSLSLTKLQNYRFSESQIKSFEVPKSGKTTTKITKADITVIAKSINDIFMAYIKIQGQIWNLVKTFCILKQKTKQILLATIEKKSFSSSRKQFMVPLDTGLQWGNAKQNSFRQI